MVLCHLGYILNDHQPIATGDYYGYQPLQVLDLVALSLSSPRDLPRPRSDLTHLSVQPCQSITLPLRLSLQIGYTLEQHLSHLQRRIRRRTNPESHFRTTTSLSSSQVQRAQQGTHLYRRSQDEESLWTKVQSRENDCRSHLPSRRSSLPLQSSASPARSLALGVPNDLPLPVPSTRSGTHLSPR